MQPQLNSSPEYATEKPNNLREFQRATLNILEDFAEEKARFVQAQSATLNILEDFAEEKVRFVRAQSAMLNILEDFEAEKMKLLSVQTAVLNILEDFVEAKHRSSQMQTATLNILEDFDAEKARLEQSQRAFINILEDIDLEKSKVVDALQRVEAVNGELEEFAYAASHDLKAPLRVIDNTSKWLEEDLQEHLTERTRKSMAMLRGRVGRMEKLLDDLLEYSRIGRSTDERYAEFLSGDHLIADILGLIAPPEDFNVRVGAGFAKIYVRRMPLQQILMNLITNAIKHHDKKVGRIDLMVEDVGDFYSIAVKDDGPGIPAQFHDQIFKMFQTLKPRDRVEGSGMGLAMVRKNIGAFGGTIKLKSSEGEGSTFQFTWPKQRSIESACECRANI